MVNFTTGNVLKPVPVISSGVNRMTFINSRVSSFELSQDDGKLTISIELLEKGGNKYVFVDEFYPRVPDQGENGGEKE